MNSASKPPGQASSLTLVAYIYIASASSSDVLTSKPLRGLSDWMDGHDQINLFRVK